MIQLYSGILILLVNLITTIFIAKKRFGKIKTYLMMLIYSIVVMSMLWIFLPMLSNTTIDLVPNIFIMIFSWAFLPLFIYLFDNRLHTLVIIMAFSYSHTLLVNGIAYHYQVITQGTNSSYSFVWMQLIVFMISTPVIILAIKAGAKRVLLSIDFVLYRFDILLPILYFIFIYISRFLITFDSLNTLIVFYALLISILILTYYSLFIILNTSRTNDSLSELVYIDHLTRKKNRYALYNDFKDICNQFNECLFYYMDLNDFKVVNDLHGHGVGDKYLIQFTDALKKAYIDTDNIYRIAGDEFVVITGKKDINKDTIKNDITSYFDFKHPFQGVSIGHAEYPKEGNTLDKLLYLADQRMYEDKKNKDK